MTEVISIKSEYKNIFNNSIVEVVAMNEIKPNDFFLKMATKYKPHAVMPLVEFIDELGNWHILSLEDFIIMYKEV